MPLAHLEKLPVLDAAMDKPRRRQGKLEGWKREISDPETQPLSFIQ